MSKSRTKSTSNKVASNAAKLLRNKRTPERVRSVAASALTQTSSGKAKQSAPATGVEADFAFKAGKDL